MPYHLGGKSVWYETKIIMVISSVPLNMGLTKIGASKSVSKFKILLLQTNRNRIDRIKVQIYVYLNLY